MSGGGNRLKKFTNQDYECYRDGESKMRRVLLDKHTSLPEGHVNIRAFDWIWKKYRRMNYDTKLLFIPWFFGIGSCCIIYYGSTYITQKEVEIEMKARNPILKSQDQYDKLKKLCEEDRRTGNVFKVTPLPEAA